MGLTKPLQGRALRIVQTLIAATTAQGHKASLGTTQGAPPPHRRRKAPPHFSITAHGESVGFLVLQEQDRNEHVPTDSLVAHGGLGRLAFDADDFDGHAASGEGLRGLGSRRKHALYISHPNEES
ncbi:hypothetical protein [Streptomyces collinus]|uniref:hypothetical protein n=1 Tax=Streptomyces collinus TaxID=42684 RepID=UPI0036ED1772